MHLHYNAYMIWYVLYIIMAEKEICVTILFVKKKRISFIISFVSVILQCHDLLG